MRAIDYLHARGLEAEPTPGGNIAVWPAENITDEIRMWVRAHKQELLQELSPANSNRRFAWRVIRGGRPIATLVGGLRSPEEALEAARARWSDAHVVPGDEPLGSEGGACHG